MTVAVSTAAAIAQIQSVIPAAYDVRIEIAFVSIALITIANLRGLRESGNIFAVPTYLFVGLALAIVAIGVDQHRRRARVVPVPPEPDAVPFRTTEALGILLLLKAFAGGSVALTGVEAIANGVPAFKPPEAKNAANTMTAMAVLLGDPVRRADGRRRSPTACARPRPAARRSSRSPPRRRSARAPALFVAVRGQHGADPVPGREHELQRLPAPRRDPGRGRLHAPPVLVPRRPPGVLVGDRPAGRHRLRACSWAFGGDTHALIPLYSVGVFVCFTLSQVGMVRHWLPRTRSGLAVADGRQRVGRGPDRRRPGHRRSSRSSKPARTWS